MRVYLDHNATAPLRAAAREALDAAGARWGNPSSLHAEGRRARALLEALNPFRKSAETTNFECGVMAATLTGGKARVEPIVARSDRLTIVGHGSVDFQSEDIELAWTLKPREGVGITAGSIANPYVGIGGTLSEPAIELKTAQAVASTGAAIEYRSRARVTSRATSRVPG